MANETPAPTSEDNLRDLKEKSMAFVVALSEPTITERDVAWHGVIASMALFNVGGNPEGLRKAIERLRKMSA